MLIRLRIIILLAVVQVGYAQTTCTPPSLSNGTFLDANYIQSLIPAGGSMFWDGNDAQFNIVGPDGGFSTIFAHGLWISMRDPGGNLRVSVATYGNANGNTDYYPGPVAADGTLEADACDNYNRAWSVYRWQIAAHQADFADNGVIDDPIDAVIGWPGTGNPQFTAVNGFELPLTPQGAAPFFDANADGLYQPLQGEYPLVPQSAGLPDQIVWSVFNSVAGEATESGSLLPSLAEVQMLFWAYNCADNPVLNNTIFASHKIINRAVELSDSLRVGLWTDFDLGCFTDDYVGSAPELNTYFAYNQFPADTDPCFAGVPSAGENAPVQAVTVLNESLDGFMYMLNASTGGSDPYPPQLFDPQTPNEINNYLNNRFADGTPLTFGGVGYDPASTDFVNHALSGDPNDPDGWSEFALNPPPRDRRGLGNVAGPSVFNPGDVFTVDVAYSYHRAPGAGHLGNVTEMYANVAEIQELYDNGFSGTCSQLPACTDDCIWSGDLNADGIANHEDVIAAGFGLAAAGPTRDIPYNWTPVNGDAWGTTQYNGADAKHLDADGNGQAELADLDQTLLHYNFVRPDYVPTVTYPPGDDLTVEASGDADLMNLEPGESFPLRPRLVTDNADLRALAFTLEYDPTYIVNFTPLPGGLVIDDMYLVETSVPGLVDFGYYLRDSEDYITPGNLFTAFVSMLDVPDDLLPTDETLIRFRNIRGYLSDGTEIDLGAQDVRLRVNGVAVSTTEPVWADGVRLFPNPVSEYLSWSFGAVRPTDYRLTDSRGRTLRSGPVIADGLDMRGLPGGVYYLHLLHAEEVVIRKVVRR